MSPAGSHKPNTAVPQAYYNAAEGVKRLTTETGAGQWGSALAFATSQFDLACEVWQVAASFTQKPYRGSMIRTWGATIHSSPSDLTEAGRAVLAEHPDSPGSWASPSPRPSRPRPPTPRRSYSLGCVLNHVLLHQTVIGEEAMKQMEMAGETPTS